MSLKSEFIIQNVVLLSKVPHVFNPSVFNQYWLHSKGIIEGSQVKEGSIFSPGLAQVITEDMNLVVTPEQIQIASIKTESAKEINTINAVELVKSMDDFSLNAMGLNFNWLIEGIEESNSEISKRFFYCDKNPASSFFNSEDAMFGGYLSKDINTDIRLKLDVKPVNLVDIRQTQQRQALQFGFNFHSDLNVANQKEKVVEIIENYDEWYNISRDIINLFK